uniref:CCHC-type domain-containing protein n=1 Tax=Ciona intestinalis TaxID=7719 RepID=H2XZ24_CIOIN
IVYSRVLQKNIKPSQLSARPNCLWIRTKEHLKREIIVNIIKKENVPLSSILGIAERKGNLIDITCKNREQAQYLQEKLCKNDAFKTAHLYQSETTLVNLSWVPIPMSHEDIKEELKKYGQVIKIIGRIDKDGPLTGRRAAIMKNENLEKNPIPSYLWIKGEELYVTYKGQEITCKYCGEVGHKQANCQTKTKDYPQLLAASGVPKANGEIN